MLHMLDRQSGVFTPQMSDRINIKSTALWENIQGMYVPPVYPKIKVDNDLVNVANNPLIAESIDSSIKVGPLHVINYRVTLKAATRLDNATIGRLNNPPNGDLIIPLNGAQLVIIVKKGNNEIKAFSSTSISQALVYFTYVV